MKYKSEELEQYDYILNEHIDKVSPKYAPLIGLFIIEFSRLEHEVDRYASESINNRAHEPGYRILKYISFANKIDYLLGVWRRTGSFTKNKEKLFEKLNKIQIILSEIHKFRNKLVHANWVTLDKSSYVRTKIDKGDEGEIVTRKTKISLHDLRVKIDQINKLLIELEEFSEHLDEETYS